MTLVLGLLLAIGIALWVLSPLITGETGETFATGSSSDLLLAKERAYDSIRDLDFDYHTGKLSESDYRTLRLQFQQEALEALKRLEERKEPGRKAAPREGPEGS